MAALGGSGASRSRLVASIAAALSVVLAKTAGRKATPFAARRRLADQTTAALPECLTRQANIATTAGRHEIAITKAGVAIVVTALPVVLAYTRCRATGAALTVQTGARAAAIREVRRHAHGAGVAIRLAAGDVARVAITALGVVKTLHTLAGPIAEAGATATARTG